MLQGSIGRILRGRKSSRPLRRGPRIAGEQLEERRLLSATYALPQLPVAINSRVAAEVATFLPGGSDSSRSQVVPLIDTPVTRTATSRVQQLVDADGDDDSALGKRPTATTNGSSASTKSSSVSRPFESQLASSKLPSASSSNHSSGSRSLATGPNGVTLGGHTTFMTFLAPAPSTQASPTRQDPEGQKLPTGVVLKVQHSFSHSGPFPANNNSATTYVSMLSPKPVSNTETGPRQLPPSGANPAQGTLSQWQAAGSAAAATETETQADAAEDAPPQGAQPQAESLRQTPVDARSAPPPTSTEPAHATGAEEANAARDVEAESCDQSLADAAAPGGSQTAEAALAKAAASQVLEAARPSPSGVDALLSEACAALAAEISTDLAAVDATLGELLDDIEDLGAGVVDTLGQFGAAPWITVATVGIAAYEHRRRRRAADGQVALADATIALFPELLGLPPAGER